MTKLAILLTLAAIAATPASPAIHLDELGFQPGAPKRAIVATDSGAPLGWRVLDAGGRTVASGLTSPFGPDAASGDTVQQVDFTRVHAPGEYRLAVDGATSHSFRIAPDVFRPLSYAALNYFYQTRAGIPIEARYAGGARWARPAGHPHEVAPCFSGPDQRGAVWPGCGRYTRDVTGGWYDAGDQGKYVVNGGIALWTLQNLYETLGPAAFADGTAKLPEAGNGVNDLLDEARWEMRFLLAMQVPDGVRMAVPVGRQPWRQPATLTDVDVGGMAHHKVADRNWTPLPTPPASDPEPRLLFPPSTAATLNLAATAAQCARIWRTIDPAFSRQCLSAATRAWAAAQRNPEIYAAQGFTGSGGYGDNQLADEFYWAAAELLATTHDPRYRQAVERSPLFAAPVSEPNWGNVAALGTITLATQVGALPPAEQAQQKALLVAAADRFLAEEPQSGYRIPYATTAYPWGSNSSILNRAMLLGVAGRLTGEAKYRAGMTDALDYILGRNPMDQSFVSGFGWKPLQNPHHRFWTHMLDPRLPGPPPGVMSGGPNSTSFADPVMAKMKGRCAPMRCWADDTRAFAANEEAINWNAPLLWVAAVLDAGAKGG